MDKTITRTFSFDGDSCEVVFSYDDTYERYFGDYPDFEECPRHTPNGWPWVTAMQNGCHHSQEHHSLNRCMDCGSCRFFRKENVSDLIGICENELNRKQI